MEIRAQRPAENAAVHQVIADAFADDGYVARIWADVVGHGLDRGSLVAVEDGDLIGHVGLSHAWLDARPRLVDVLALSPLSVVPRHQGRGVGTGLLAAALETAEATGAPAVFLEGSPDYYGRRGFAPATPRHFEAPSRRIPEPAFQVVLLGAYQRWMTGRVVYHDVWWDHDAAGLRDPVLSEVEHLLAAAD